MNGVGYASLRRDRAFAPHKNLTPYFMLLFKLIIVILLLFVVGSLFTALFFLVKDPSNSQRVVKSLSWRIALSLFILLLLFVGIQTGLIVPHDVGG